MRDLISAALIVRDEARFLPDCLASIREVVDEIVVVDTGSVDETPAIAESFGARVFHQPWTDNFAEARNAGLDRCRGQWILYIDADERLAPVGRAEVVSLLADAPEVAFRLLLQPVRDATPYREYRLWRNDPRIRFEGVIHEKVVPSIHAVASAARMPIGLADLLLTHVGYEGDQERKHRRNLPLLLRQVQLEPENLFVWHHLARVQAGLGDQGGSERTLARAIEVARGKPYVDPLGVLPYSDLIAGQLDRGEEVRPLLAEARERYPRNCVLVWLAARALLAAGRPADALGAYEFLLTVDPAALPPDEPSYDTALFGEIPHAGRALCLFRLGRYAEAARAYAEAERCSPGSMDYRVKRDLSLSLAARTSTALTAATRSP